MEQEWKKVLWNRLREPLITTGVCVLLGIVVPAVAKATASTRVYETAFEEFVFKALGFVCSAALLMLLSCPVRIIRAVKSARLDLGSETVTATVTAVRDRHVRFNDKQLFTLTCEGDGRSFQANVSTDYRDRIGWKVPVRTSTFYTDMYEVLLDQMQPPEEETPSAPRGVDGPVTWNWDESGVNRKDPARTPRIAGPLYREEPDEGRERE